MISNVIMVGIVIFLAMTLVAGAQVREDGQHFFDINNSNALRGFWCLIVVLVHIPVAHQNRIQDMVGSFAYVGVTFFFMTSAYGLKLQMRKSPNRIKMFWKRRLPKLLIPCFVVNLLNILVNEITNREITILSLFKINNWVVWLLVCYFFFWISYRFMGGYKDCLTIILVSIFSVTVYALKKYDSTLPGWCPEIFGFVWGLCLVDVKENVLRFAKKQWILKVAVLGLASCVCGLGYLKLKLIVFWGDYLLKIVLGLLLLALLLYINARICFGNKVNAFLGEISFEVYLTHELVFRLIDKWMPSINFGIYIVISLLITVILAVLAKYLSQCVLVRANNIISVE